MVGHKLHHLASLTAATTIKLASSLPVFPFYTNKVHLPLILVPPAEQFRHVFRCMLLSSMAPDVVPAPAPAPAPARPGLRKVAPYWYPCTTMAKGRWLNREILEIVSTEFRDRSIEYYVWLSLYRVRFAEYVLKGGTGRGLALSRDTRSHPVSRLSMAKSLSLTPSSAMGTESKTSCTATNLRSRLDPSRSCTRTWRTNSS